VDERLRIEALPCKRVTGVQSKLADEGALSTAVALAERMNRVDLGVIVGKPLGETLARQATEMLLTASSRNSPVA
jgi:hypothetical protein